MREGVLTEAAEAEEIAAAAAVAGSEEEDDDDGDEEEEEAMPSAPVMGAAESAVVAVVAGVSVRTEDSEVDARGSATHKLSFHSRLSSALRPRSSKLKT